jgi:hypothetical protein
MHTRDAILYVLHSARHVTDAYLSDLNDQDIVVRPAPNAHNIAWQLGHLLLSEAMMARSVQTGMGITFPADFEVSHSAAGEGPYLSKAQYIELRTAQRERTLMLVRDISDSELALPGPEKMRSYAPTKGTVLLAIGTHEMMHAGQMAVVRRLLSKPVVI